MSIGILLFLVKHLRLRLYNMHKKWYRISHEQQQEL